MMPCSIAFMRSVPVALSSFEGQRKWVAARLGLVAAFLLCTVRVACRENLSTVVGGVIPGIEAVKLGLDLGGQSIEELLRGIRDQLGVWPLLVPITIVIVKTIRLPKPNVCRLTLDLGGWFLTPERYGRIKDEHGPSSTVPKTSKYTPTSWTMLLWLIDSTLYRADSAVLQPYRGRCVFTVLDFGFPTGTDLDGRTLVTGNVVVMQVLARLKWEILPNKIVTSFPD